MSAANVCLFHINAHIADINECIEEGKDAECAEAGATCVNDPGTYHCECEEGYELNALGICEGSYFFLVFSMVMKTQV